MAVHVIRTTPQRLGFEIRSRELKLRRAMRYAAVDSANATLRKVSKDSPVDTGFYKNSWDASPGSSANLAKPGAILAELRNDAPHAGIIELGSRPHWPPLEPLVEWVLRNARSFGIGRGQNREAEARRIARLIQFKIARYGTKAYKVMAKNLPYARARMKLSLERQLRQIARR